MSEHPTGTITSPESTTGLAMILGETRSELRHQTEEVARRFDELYADLAEETATREAADVEHKEAMAGITDVVSQLVAVVEALAPKKSSPTVKEPKSSLPARGRGENNKVFHGRLIDWANERGSDTPPKPKSTEFPNAYDKRIREWGQEIGT